MPNLMATNAIALFLNAGHVGVAVMLVGLLTASDRPALITLAQSIGNPAIAQFPNDNKADAFGRSVWDLHLHQGQIYVGTGDWTRNRGPITVYRFTPQPQGSIAFTSAYTVAGEAVERFVSFGDALVIPDIDPQEAWAWGNLYVLQNQDWVKRRTIPQAVHVFDAAQFQDKWYVATAITGQAKTRGALFESGDSGQTWRAIPGDYAQATRLYGAVPTTAGLLLFDNRPERQVYLFNGETVRTVPLNAVPGGAPSWQVAKLTPFKGGALYLQPFNYAEALTRDRADDALVYPSALFWLENTQTGARQVGPFGQKKVTDFIVQGDRCYVLSFEVKGEGFLGEIYSSTDLENWQSIAAIDFPAIPTALERTDDGTFYIGLGATFYSDSPTRQQSGSIWRLNP